MTIASPELQKQLSLALSQVRTEYTPEAEVFEMFSLPVYWGQLQGMRPCFLVGGRGTGKTTTLRGLTFAGQQALHGSDVNDWQTVGVYWRVDSNVVRAFQGRRIDEEKWTSLFSHYVNLQLVNRLLLFAIWMNREPQMTSLTSTLDLDLICVSLDIEECNHAEELQRQVKAQIARLELKLNGPASGLEDMTLSALGRPIAYLVDSLVMAGYLGTRHATFCIDEFENLLPYQQAVVNTLIKHTGDSRYTFTVGVRDSALRSRATLVDAQPLTEPADYTSINIVNHLKDQVFSNFAAQVCSKRLSRLPGAEDIDVRNLFPELDANTEASLLGVEEHLQALSSTLLAQGASKVEMAKYEAWPSLEKYLVKFWARGSSKTELDVLQFGLANPSKWQTRYNNYQYSLLFTLREGKRGRHKYYSGWSVYAQMADGNVRYALQLTYEALNAHFRSGHDLSSSVSHETQSDAAVHVGDTAVRELRGISGQGGQITKLTLGLGRIFGVMASDAFGHAPEVTQFRLTSSNALVIDRDDNDALLKEAVGHGALVPFDGDKNALRSGDTKAPDYKLHPIFAAYFVYSYRSKRRMTISEVDFAGLYSENAAPTIKKILDGRGESAAVSLPEPMELFKDFFL